MTEKRYAFRALVRNSEGKRCLHNTGICEGNINISLKEIRQKDTDWTYLAQDRDTWWALVNKVTTLWVP